MLKLFSAGRAKHPLVDSRQVDALVKSLPVTDSSTALATLIEHFEELSQLDDVPVLAWIDSGERFDSAAQLHARRVARDCFAATGTSNPMQNAQLRQFWERAANALTKPFDALTDADRESEGLRKVQTAAVARALRAWAQVFKWRQLEYLAVDPVVWGRIYSLYALIESVEQTNATTKPHPRISFETTVRREFMRIVAFDVAHPSEFEGHFVEPLDRVLDHCAAVFDLHTAPQDLPHPLANFGFDLRATKPPTRVSGRLDPCAGLRFLNGARVLQPLQALLDEITIGQRIPESLGIETACDPIDLQRLTQHLMSIFGPNPPIRRLQRRAIQVPIQIVRGWDCLIETIAPQVVDTPISDGPRELELVESESLNDSWITEAIGIGGLAAVAPRWDAQAHTIGALLGVRAQSASDWQVGIVRRLERRTTGGVLVGVDTISLAPRICTLTAPNAPSRQTETAVLLDDPQGKAEVRVLFRPGVAAAGVAIDAVYGEHTLRLVPQQLSAASSDYEVMLCATS